MRLGKSSAVLLLAAMSASVASGWGSVATAAGVKGPKAVAAAPKAENCQGLKKSADAAALDEWASCISVGAQLSRVPAVGQTAELTVTVRSAASRPRAEVDVDLPANLEFVRTSSMSLSKVLAAEGVGSAQRATRRDDLKAGGSRSYTATVRATAPGFGQIRARAVAAVGKGRVDAGSESVFLTVGADASSSRMGRDLMPAVNGTAQPPSLKAASRPALPIRMGISPPGVAGSVGNGPQRLAGPGTACVTGQWEYYDQNGTMTGAYNTVVQVVNGGTVLASQYAGGDGGYNLCWGTGGQTQNVTILFIEDNNVWKVVDANNNDLRFGDNVSVADGQTLSVGPLVPADGTLNRGVHAYEEANDEYQWDRGVVGTGGCWDLDETSSCRQLSIIWSNTSTDGTYWNGSVHLKADDPNAAITVEHEVGHNLMYNLYDGYMPPSPSCNPHSIFGASSTGCAWVEGWAEWAPASINNDPYFRWPDGSSLNLDTPTWGDGNPNGDATEGRIAGALIDIANYGSEPYWDNYGEGGGLPDPSAILTELYSNSIGAPNVFADFWNGRATLGYNTAQDGALSSVYQNTIDYGFRNPLSDYTAKNFSQPTPHNYSETTHTNYWSAVVIRPGANDYDLTVFGDYNQTIPLASSTFGTGVMDFVAIDSNRQAQGAFYPRVSQFNGTGNYDVELAQGAQILNAGSANVAMGSGEVSHILDSYQTAGIPVFVRVVPTDPSQQGEALLLADDPNNSATWVQGRGAAVAGSGVSSPGAEFGFSYTPTTTEYHGLLLLNAAGSGSYNIYVDNAAPTGTISINGGAATTITPDVALTLSASSSSGVDQMQISTDGVITDGPIQPYVTSANVTLPGPNGTKTVLVRYRNQAGMWSQVYSASINLEVAPSLGSVSPPNGPSAGGQSVTISGSNLTGATAVTFGATAAAGYTVVNDSTITATTPAHTVGAVSVKVTTPAGTSNAVTYKFVAAKPAISSVSPNAGPTAGGQTVTITGSNFTGATSVKFGTTPAASFTVVSATTITAVTPARAAGVIDVRVTTAQGTSPAAAADHYAYQAAPTITSVSPISGTHLGGTTVTIIGTNFTGATTVKFGTASAASFTVVSSTKIIATAPAHGKATVDIRITGPGGTSAMIGADHYRFT